MVEADVPMFQFFGAKLFDRRPKVRFMGAQRFSLGMVVFFDDFFNGYGAGHGRFRPHHGGCGPQGEAGYIPNGPKQGGTDPAFDQETIERGPVGAFLFRHVPNCIAMGAFAENRELALVNPRGTVFACVIDPDHAFDLFAARGIAGQGPVEGGTVYGIGHDQDPVLRVRIRRAARITGRSEASMFHPASEMPNKDHWITSH